MNQPKDWGPWTEAKLDALGSYLPGFTRAASKAGRTLYLDLLSGGLDNIARATGAPIQSSVQIALATKPHFTKVVACELNAYKAAQLRTLPALHPGRDIEVLHGDCNREVPLYLDKLRRRDPDWAFAPTFAFVDQLSAEVTWATLQSLATFKSPASPTKPEIWLYFGDSFLPRGLAGINDPNGEMNATYASRIDLMFGNTRWRDIHEARRQGQINAGQLRDELVNLMRYQLQSELGYAITYPLAFSYEQRPLYTMIFATDHPAGGRIMNHVLKDAQAALERQHRQSRADRRNADDGLFDFAADHVAPRRSATVYAPEPVRQPWPGI